MKSVLYEYWRLILVRVAIYFLTAMALSCSLPMPIAVLAEFSEKEVMIDMRFTDYEDLYFALLDITIGPEDDAQFDSLSEVSQSMFIAAIFDMQVQDGGLCQFFVNSGSLYAERVADSLKVIGLEPMGILYESFLSDNQIDPAALSSFRINAVQEYAAQHDRYPFDSFDSAYMDLWEKLDFNNAMLSYANGHPEAFPQP